MKSQPPCVYDFGQFWSISSETKEDTIWAFTVHDAVLKFCEQNNIENEYISVSAVFHSIFYLKHFYVTSKTIKIYQTEEIKLEMTKTEEQITLNKTDKEILDMYLHIGMSLDEALEKVRDIQNFRNSK